VWLVDVAREVTTRFTFEPGGVAGMLWSPDGKRLAYGTERNGLASAVVKSVDGALPETTLFANGDLKNFGGWSADGKYITYEQLNQGTGWDLYVIPADGTAPAKPYLNGPFNERWGTISPDGHWMLYASSESGQLDLYVQSFPNPGNKYRVTANGGGISGWRRDGREIMFVSQDFKSVYACDVTTAPTFHASVPHLLFRFPEGTQAGSLASDFQRVLLPVQADDSAPATVTVALDWASQLQKR
jgi:Tol biopolymer transport system component